MDKTFLDVKDTIEVRNDVIAGGFSISDPPDTSTRINHYLKKGYKLLHIGQETVDGQDGEPRQCTVAILGQ